ncbi:hypothetical protein MRB53_029646 [Persea americana]|uniref:Uncharacterized protein n=1 Tax=Persea americana TaxID=3435 RepID=A0ACC2KIX6_PERAE|nr:hypothetical protein MRB53_029646 [Persea americana]
MNDRTAHNRYRHHNLKRTSCECASIFSHLHAVEARDFVPRGFLEEKEGFAMGDVDNVRRAGGGVGSLCLGIWRRIKQGLANEREKDGMGNE